MKLIINSKKKLSFFQKKVLITFYVIFFSTTIFWGQQVDFNNPPIAIHTLTIGDGMTYVDPEISVSNKVTLNPASYIKLHVDNNQAYTIPYTLSVQLTITPHDQNGNPQLSLNYNRVFSISYNPYSDAPEFTDEVFHLIENKYGVSVKITDIKALNTDTNTPLAQIPENNFFQLGFKGDRYYQLATTIPSVQRSFLPSSANPTSLRLSWQNNGIPGALEYDVEWTWVDNYGLDGQTLNANNVRLLTSDFVKNSTRIQTSNTFYEIPLIYSQGFLVYRVRAVGRFLDAPQKYKYGNWSISPIANTVSDWGSSNYVTLANSHEEQKNWQFQASYAEEGKRKDVVSYFDGSLHNRQTVTKINSDDNAIVGEVIYDAQGRPAIEVLPVPTTSREIKFYEDFNKNADNTEIFTYHDFDFDAVDEDCEVETEGMNTARGAARYYSSNNAVEGPHKDFIPSAVDTENTNTGYPFAQIEYTPDNTGRIRRKGGIGVDHQLGSDHEMKYFYGQPNSSFELNRLFGYHVGELSHYKKNIIVDPNGQVSISYIGPQGRTIATALAGGNPTQLNSLEDEIDPSGILHNYTTVDLLNKVNSSDTDTNQDNNIRYATGENGALNDGLQLLKQIVVIENNADYEFDYSLNNDDVYNYLDCPSETYPYEYDLTLSLRDDCSTDEFLAPPIVVQNRITSYELTDPLQAILPIGEHTINKNLTVSQEALEEHWEHFIANTECLLTEEAFAPQFIDLNCEDINCQMLENTTKEEYIIENLVSIFGNTPLPYIQNAGEIEANPALDTEIFNEVEVAILEFDETYDILIGLCELPDFSVIFQNILLADFIKDGQYASTGDADGNITDPLSIFNEQNSLYYNGNINNNTNYLYSWRHPLTPYMEDGEISRISVSLIDGAWFPEITVANPDPDNTVAPEQLANLSDFLFYWNNDWAHSLVGYHPEYNHYLYLNSLSQNTPSNLAYNTFEYANYLREINTYSDAITEGLFSSETSLITNDAFFNQIYLGENTTHLSARSALIESAITENYEASNLKMLENFYAIAVCGNLSVSCSGIPSSTFNALKNNIDNLDADLQNSIWQSYREGYLHLRQRLIDIFLTVYVRSQGTDNYCLGGQATTTDVLSVLNHYDTSDIDAILGTEGSNSLCATSATLYSEKEKRYLNTDYLYNAVDYEQNSEIYLQDILEQSEEDYYNQTGTCLSQLRTQIFLDGLFKDTNIDNVFTTSGMDYDGNYLALELLEDVGGSQGVQPIIKGIVNGDVLSIDLSVAGQCTDPFLLELPESTYWNPTYNWNNYGNVWTITHMTRLYFDELIDEPGRYHFQILAKVLIAGVEREFVFDGSTCANLASCIPLDDEDCDGVPDSIDNCPSVYNPSQTDLNGNLIGDICETSTLPCAEGIQASGGSGVYIVEISLSEAAGEVEINYDSFNIPDRFRVEYNGTEVADSKYVGNTDLVNNLQGSYLLHVFEYDATIGDFVNNGETEVVSISEEDLSDSQNSNNGEGTLTFTKGPGAGIMKVYAYGPRGNTAWIMDFGCPVENPIPDVDITEGNACCIVQPVRPLSCNEKFDTYVNGLNLTQNPNTGIYTSQLIAGHEEAVFFSEEFFCDMQYAYITDSYLYYINTKLTNSTTIDPFYLNIADFGNTVLHYGFDDINTPENDMFVLIDNFTGEVSWQDYIFAQSIAQDLCPPLPPQQDFNIPIELTDPCQDLINSIISSYTQENYLEYLELVRADFEEGYINGAMNNAVENYTMRYPDKEYQYTLYYYDQAGNLIQTVSPEGVTRLGDGLTDANKIALNASINQDIAANTENTLLPQHNLQTQYRYNSLNQLVWQQTPDGGISRFAYDDLGRIIASQNAWQDATIGTLNLIGPNPESYNVSSDGKEITKLNGGWKEAVSQEFMTGNGYIERTLNPNFNKNWSVSFGLNYADTDVNAAAPYAMAYTFYTYTTANGNYVRWHSNGAYVGHSFYEPNDVLKIERTNGQVHYYKNGILLSTVNEIQPGEPLQIAVNIFNANAKVENINFVDYGTNNTAFEDAERFSYTMYDGIGRIIEAGEIAPEANQYRITDQGRLQRKDTNDQFIPVNEFTLSDGIRQEITQTVYDKPVSLAAFPGGSTLINESTDLFEGTTTSVSQRNRVTGVLYYDRLPVLQNAGGPQFTNAIFYNYDIHGNVKELINFYPDLYLAGSNRHIKSVNYEYDLISGNVQKVIYQKGHQDQFIHKYTYDADNRITDVYTSRNGHIWEQDASYQYYAHGPMARMEVGDKQVQGSDYVYTLQGWLKSVNGEYIEDSNNDIGKDGIPNSLVARDAFGFSLGYYNSDYNPIGTITGDPFSLSTPSTHQLYNGNINQMVTSLRQSENQMLPASVSNYTYDQLNRIKTMQSQLVTGNNATSIAGHESSYSYDRNGNLLTLSRKALQNGVQQEMDNFTYHYKDNTNQLTLVNDAINLTLFEEDLDDQEYQIGVTYDASNIDSHNYVYDEIGQLIEDKTEKLRIFWRVDGKVEKVEKYENGFNRPITQTTIFSYDGLGNRITKTIVPNQGDIVTTRYARDAQGNVLSVFETVANNEEYENDTFTTITNKENHIYGSSRLGIEQSNIDITSQNILGLNNASDIVLELGNNKSTEWQTNNAAFQEGKFGVVNFEQTIDFALNEVVADNDSIQVASLAFSRKNRDGIVQKNALKTYFKNVNNRYFPVYIITSETAGGTLDTKYITTAISFSEADVLQISSLNVFNTDFIPEDDLKNVTDVSLKINNLTLSLSNGLLVMTEYNEPAATVVEEVPTSTLGGTYITTFQARSYSYKATTEQNSLVNSFDFSNQLLTSGLRSAPSMIAIANDPIWVPSTFANANVYYDYENIVGDKRYELSNHLGNVLSVVTDKKIPTFTNSSLNYFNADVVTYNDYYPFGMIVPDRHENTSDYRYGFQGQELDNELKGEGNSLNYTFRMHDPRVGRFFATDPLKSRYPYYSPYTFSGNIVIHMIELEGLEPAASEQAKQKALEIVTSFEKEKDVNQHFKNITKEELIRDLRKVIIDPAQIMIPDDSGYYCALYCWAHAYAKTNPEDYARSVISFFKIGKAKINGITIDGTTSNEISDENANKHIPNRKYHEVSAYIFGTSLREEHNIFWDVDPAIWETTATLSGNMKDVLRIFGYTITEFDYGDEWVADGIVKSDLGALSKHIANEGMAFLRVDYGQFKKREGTGTGKAYGNHWIIIHSNFTYNKIQDTVTFEVYEDHGGSRTITMDRAVFSDMTNHVIMTSKEEKKND